MSDEQIEVNYVRWLLGNSHKCKELLASFWVTALSLIYAFYLIAVSPPPAQFRPLTESAPERVSCPAHPGEAGSDRVRAARRRKGPHSTASVL